MYIQDGTKYGIPGVGNRDCPTKNNPLVDEETQTTLSGARERLRNLLGINLSDFREEHKRIIKEEIKKVEGWIVDKGYKIYEPID